MNYPSGPGSPRHAAGIFAYTLHELGLGVTNNYFWFAFEIWVKYSPDVEANR